jgi:hypothetical protein
VAPFDTELFGHWWYEGPQFLGSVYRALRDQPDVRPVTASRHLDTFRARTGIRLATGSWGANGDFSMWLNAQTAFMWPRIWDLETRFWTIAREAIALPSAHEALAQAARELLLVQSSDWQFIVSTGAVTDYGIRRFNGHADACDRLFDAIRDGLASVTWRTRPISRSSFVRSTMCFRTCWSPCAPSCRESATGRWERGTGNGNRRQAADRCPRARLTRVRFSTGSQFPVPGSPSVHAFDRHPRSFLSAPSREPVARGDRARGVSGAAIMTGMRASSRSRIVRS